MSTGVRGGRRRRLGVAVGVLVVLGSLLPHAGAAPRAASPEEGPVTVVQTQAGRPVPAARDYARLLALPSVDTGARPRSTAPFFTGADPCPPPRCSDRAVPVPRGVQVTSNTVRVLLPVGYGEPANRTRRYPVVFLWNGLRNDHDAWTRVTELMQASRSWQAIFVMPAGGKNAQAGMFSDWADGSYDWETYHMKVLVPWVDRQYRTLKGARVSAGASVGGLGAINYAARHPGVFRAVLGVSTLADTTGMEGDAVLPRAGWPDPRRVWGDPVLDKANWDAHNPLRQVVKLRGTPVWLTSGTGYSGDPGKDKVVSGDTEKTLWEMHHRLLSEFTLQGVPYRARVAIGGAHYWDYFDPMVQWAMPEILRTVPRP